MPGCAPCICFLMTSNLNHMLSKDFTSSRHFQYHQIRDLYQAGSKSTFCFSSRTRRCRTYQSLSALHLPVPPQQSSKSSLSLPKITSSFESSLSSRPLPLLTHAQHPPACTLVEQKYAQADLTQRARITQLCRNARYRYLSVLPASHSTNVRSAEAQSE